MKLAHRGNKTAGYSMKNSSLLLFSIIILLAVNPFDFTQAQEGVGVANQEVEYTFAEKILFRLELEGDLEIEAVNLVIQSAGFPSFVGAATLTSPEEAQFVYDLTQRPLPAFSHINYAYHVILENGDTYETPFYSFTYLDNRYNWQELIQEPFRIFWYEGEITLAQEILDVALQGQGQILDLLQQPAGDQPITIFIYSSEEELQSTLTSLGQSWVGGHADPALGSVVVALPPAVDQPLEIQRLIPHEIAHIILYRFMGVEYSYLPTWLSEGIASQMEFYTLPEYDLILEKAYNERGLIPIAHICSAFPTDPDLARLSYAQAYSFVEYIQQEYGVTGLQVMIYAYDQGVSCERGVETALGISLADLEKEWKLDTFARDTYLTYIYILGGVLLVLVLALGIFIYLKVKENPAEEDWGSDESD
jgi:hypothetical protein